MEGEIENFILVWLTVLISLCYCFAAAKIISPGISRLISLLPIISLFLLLPLRLSTIHLIGPTSFAISWLANFKLLLLAFGSGPLAHSSTSSGTSSVSLPRFLILACLPIKIPDEDPSPAQKPFHTGHESGPSYAIKALIVALLVRVYDFRSHFHKYVMWLLFCVHIYLFLELMLVVAAAAARVVLGVELEPQFNKPYLSTSLRDFWGRRWNLMVTRILRPTVYQPTLKAAARVLGRKWAPLPAVMATFLVSALMHELIFYYLSRESPTWEVTWFFVLHGAFLVLEIGLRKVVPVTWRLPRIVSGSLTVAFVLVTSFWLFFPPFISGCRADVRAFEEYAALGAFLRSAAHVLGF